MTRFFVTKLSKPLLMAVFCIGFVSACSQDNSGEAIAQKPLPEVNTAGAQLLEKYCSDCHLPPHPDLHAQGEWKNVVLRMSHHRTMRGYHTLSDEELITLTDYLEKHASRSQ